MIASPKVEGSTVGQALPPVSAAVFGAFRVETAAEIGSRA